MEILALDRVGVVLEARRDYACCRNFQGGFKMKRFCMIALAAVLFPLAAGAQESKSETNPVSNAVKQSVARMSKNMVAAADAMPADKYNFHPTPEQMTFSHLVAHMVGSNFLLCSKISGVAAPESSKVTDKDPKEKLVSALKASFDFCTETLSKVDDSNLGETLTLFGTRTASRAGAMIALTNDFADHYGMAAMYLRLNGILPPTAQPQK
jgi:uncharacterized damage-inducible protein DinB